MGTAGFFGVFFCAPTAAATAMTMMTTVTMRVLDTWPPRDSLVGRGSAGSILSAANLKFRNLLREEDSMRDNIRGSIVAVITIAMLPAVAVLRAQNDPLIGHWVLDAAKSKYEGTAMPRSEMRVYEAFGGVGKGIKGTFDRVDAQGKRIH